MELMLIKEDVKFNFSLFLMVKNISTMRATNESHTYEV